MKANFYDIESLSNVFSLCNYKPDELNIDIYFLVDDEHLINNNQLKQELLKVIKQRNANFKGDITLFNLATKEANDHMAKTFGLSDSNDVNNPNMPSSYGNEFRPVCDTDTIYDSNKHPFLFGYNSYNYDTTLLSMYFNEVYLLSISNQNGLDVMQPVFSKTEAKIIRSYNDELFTPEFKDKMPNRLTMTYDMKNRVWSEPNWQNPMWKIRKSMLRTGRHIDVARLNEKQQRVALKRLLGLLGHQILESDKLGEDNNTIETPEEFYELIAYNVSDVINLELLFKHPLYQAQFSLKQGLLKSYPETIYNEIPNEYKPNISSTEVRRDRLTIDSSSAQFATKCLCPYGHLTDYPVVSFLYPSEDKAKELGIPQTNVLEESKKFFYDNFPQPELRAEFDEKVYNFYKQIEGNNYNSSDNYKKDWENSPKYKEPSNLHALPKINTNMFYYYKDGSPSKCYITFSTGGIHGAEYNKVLYDYDCLTYNRLKADMDYVKRQYPNPCDLKIAKNIIMPNNEKLAASKFLKSGSTQKKAEYKDITNKEPELFTLQNGSYKIAKKYVFTSAAFANHEDFESYYPNMLIMMEAFKNLKLGYDRYNEIFLQKREYGEKKKDKTLTKEELNEFDIKREGTKLILNSASGAGDTVFSSNIQVNNKIISMRIIGQLFSWRIGQAQTIEGAEIPSTNTDGLYSVLEPEFNAKILKRESANIGVKIEPERMYLISKDSNSRVEIDIEDNAWKIISASGSNLGCYNEPKVTQKLTHPAIIDWALAEYLIVASTNYKGLSLEKELDRDIGMSIFKSASKVFKPIAYLRMLQNIVSSSTSSDTYAFGLKRNDTNPIFISHYNRIFMMKDSVLEGIHIQSAVSKKITTATKMKRIKNGERPQIHDPLAVKVLEANGVSIKSFDSEHEAAIKKVTNIDDTWNVIIENRSLFELTDDEINYILDNIDYERYVDILESTYNKNWMNNIPKEDNGMDSKTKMTVSLQNKKENQLKEITDHDKILEIMDICNMERPLIKKEKL